ncbi:MAG: choice-of-anchor B family protein, partial [Acidobacteria bacterium]|nr:choice-of-anchor B family protein [Acidobacteriota bacterium]
MPQPASRHRAISDPLTSGRGVAPNRARSGSLRVLLLLVCLTAAVPLFAQGPPADEPNGDLSEAQRAFLAEPAAVDGGSAVTVPEHSVLCVDGDAEGYSCERVDLLAHLPLNTIGGGSGADLWGWTDPMTGKEYALMGLTNGTAFVDISDPEEPVHLGNLPTHTVNSTWRDIKTYGNYAYIVSEASGHGLQIFDLTELRSVTTPPVTFTETAHYPGFGRAHNVVLDEATGFAYAVGSRENSAPFEACSGGLHMIDLSNPTAPTFAGCFSADGYTHDAQCVVYHGTDSEHDGAEICFASNEDTLTIVDVTDKGSPQQLSRTSYTGVGYTHQGWLTEDHKYFLLDDELDESNFGHNTRTYIWDLADLEAPSVLGTYTGPVASSDHNQYVKGRYVYQANYKSGLRILSLDDVGSGSLTEVAHFDI